MASAASPDLAPQVSRELQLPAAGVQAILRLLAEGNTVPFIARYRKEATGGLDEVAIRAVEERAGYLVELEARRGTILESIASQGLLDPALEAKLLACTNKAELEDLYLPYKPKRRTRATLARERGLAPLAERIAEQPAQGDPQAEALAFVDPERSVPDVEAALSGARDIIAERVAEDAALRARARRYLADRGRIRSKLAKDASDPQQTFADFYDFEQPLRDLPAHRYLALRRGEKEEVLRLGLEVDEAPLLASLLPLLDHRPRSPFGPALAEATEDGLHRLMVPSLRNELMAEHKDWADRAAVEVFAANLRALLLAAPLGEQAVLAIDPGLRTGCKCCALDATGKLLEARTIQPHAGGPGQRREAAATLLALLRRHGAGIIAVGNGTAGRETEAFAAEALTGFEGERRPVVVSVSEAGASVYSASDVARSELPGLDVSERGAVSIGRRLQDPLAELVKIDPRSIGVGQYQHDVDAALLARKLDEVVESCVNSVGVELNTASPALLARVAGLGPAKAEKIVAFRNENGPFPDRRRLLKVPTLGPKTFEQAAGFLRVRNGKHPLDASAVHPERYPLVERMAADLGQPLAKLVGSPELVQSIPLAPYLGGDVGEPTLRDILAELARPGRDPRDRFEPLRFREDVHSPDDLLPGMELPGVVTNVTAFGAFVDVGVHRDGLVHVSQLSERFVRDPQEVVQPGQRLTVWVIDVDRQRGRISLSALPPNQQRTSPPRSGDTGAEPSPRRPDNGPRRPDNGPRRPDNGPRRDNKPRQPAAPAKDGFANNPFQQLLKKK